MDIQSFDDLSRVYQNLEENNKEIELPKEGTISQKIEAIVKGLQKMPVSQERNHLLDACLKVAQKEGKEEEIKKIKTLVQNLQAAAISSKKDLLKHLLSITVVCGSDKKTFTYPIEYKQKLEKDSFYFENIFSGKYVRERKIHLP